MFRNIKEFLYKHELLKTWIQICSIAMVIGTVLGLAGYGAAHVFNYPDVAMGVFKIVFGGIVGVAGVICVILSLFSLILPKSM